MDDHEQGIPVGMALFQSLPFVFFVGLCYFMCG